MILKSATRNLALAATVTLLSSVTAFAACDGLLGEIKTKMSRGGGFASPLNDIVAVTQNKWVQGLRSCTQNRQYRKRAEAYYRLGQLLAFKGKRYHGEAISAYQRALSTGSWTDGGSNIRRRLAALYRLNERWQSYIATSDRLLADDPKTRAKSQTYMERGKAFEAMGQSKAAINAYSRAASIMNRDGLPISSQQSVGASAADRVFRHAYSKPICKVLDGDDTNFDASLDAVNSCLASKRLAKMDRARLLWKRIGIKLSEQAPAAAVYKDVATLMALKPDLPRVRQVDLDSLLFRGVRYGQSLAHRYLEAQVANNQGAKLDQSVTMVSSRLQTYLRAAAKKGSGYTYDYRWVKEKERTSRFAREQFVRPVINWLSEAGNEPNFRVYVVAESKQDVWQAGEKLSMKTMIVNSFMREGKADKALASLAVLEREIGQAGDQQKGFLAQVHYLRAGAYNALGDPTAALVSIDRWFVTQPADWAEQAKDPRRFIEAEVFRADMAIRAGKKNRAQQSIDTLSAVFARFNQPCAVCEKLSAQMVDPAADQKPDQ